MAALHTPTRQAPDWRWMMAAGFAYWVTFLSALEPSKVQHALDAGRHLSLRDETVRILVAAFMGTAVTPIVVNLARLFPVLGVARLRHALIHLAGGAGLAISLIVVSCVFAAWGFGNKLAPSLAEVRWQLGTNGLLLTYALLGFSGLAHLFFLTYGIEGSSDAAVPGSARTPAPPLPRHIPIKKRGHQSFLSTASIEWVETVGNYLALHAGSETHLIRETLVSLEAKLGPQRYVRVHRGVIVAADRIQALRPLANGDATLMLKDGRELRVSRGYRKTLKAKWHADLAPGHETSTSRL